MRVDQERPMSTPASSQLFGGHPIEGEIERGAKFFDQLIDMRGLNDEWRTHRHPITAQWPNDQTVVLCSPGAELTDLHTVKGPLTRFIGHELQRTDHAYASNFADQRMIAEYR